MVPADPVETKVREALDRLGVPYEVIPCDPEYADTAAFCERYGVPPGNSANAILVATRKEPRRFAVCMVLATARLDVNHSVKKLLGGSKVSFATKEDTVRVTGMVLGGVTPFQLPEEIAVFVDEAMMDLDYVVVGGGGRTSKIRISPEVFHKIPQAQIVSGLSRPKPR